jgi:hypothetical protein
VLLMEGGEGLRIFDSQMVAGVINFTWSWMVAPFDFMDPLDKLKLIQSLHKINVWWLG